MSIPISHRLLATGIFPDALIRWHVRGLCRQRIEDDQRLNSNRESFLADFVKQLEGQLIALQPDVANLQHYEVSTAFFIKVLGKRMKYSSCFWPDEIQDDDLDRAEEAMLALTCARAGIENGMDVLELGCGWGSLSLYMAEHFPGSQITAVSNSATQKAFIDQKIQEKGFGNLNIITADMNNFAIDRQFDRVVSVEMFEHMRNWGALLSRIKNWLKADGRLFIHIFTYDGKPYLYDGDDPSDWMAYNFFAGGMMPCPELPYQFSDIFQVIEYWNIPGTHYQKTLEAWLRKMDARKAELFPLFRKEYGTDAVKFWNHWRVFFMSCAEVFGYKEGKNWSVGHYLMR